MADTSSRRRTGGSLRTGVRAGPPPGDRPGRSAGTVGPVVSHGGGDLRRELLEEADELAALDQAGGAEPGEGAVHPDLGGLVDGEADVEQAVGGASTVHEDTVAQGGDDRRHDGG